MFRRNVQRGVATLAFVLAVTLAGAEPAAAAANPGFLGRLVNAWSAVTGTGGQALTSVLDRLSGRARFAVRNGQEKRGWGVDPNGMTVAIDGEEEPDATPTPPGGQ